MTSDGLVRRGSLTYRKAADGSLEFEGADFDARHYSPALTRWLTPDPLSEKYYGISPYAYCNRWHLAGDGTPTPCRTVTAIAVTAGRTGFSR